MPRSSRSAFLLVGALVVLGVIGLLLWSFSRPPELARLLPEADAIVYADLRPVRLATHLDRDLPPRAPAYQHFVDATGIVPERDLDLAAFALTRRPDPTGVNGPVAYTELLGGRFDTARLERYLAGLAASTELYAGHTLFTLHMDTGSIAVAGSAGDPAAGRDLRIAVVRPGLLALSNAPTAEQIHAMLDHARAGLFGSPAPSLLTAHFADVPRLSSAWAIGLLGLPLTNGGNITLLGLTLPLPADQSFIASLRYVGVLRLRIEALTPSPDAALEQAGALTSLAGLARTLLTAAPGASPSGPLLTALDSVRIEPHGSRAVLSASLPLDLLRQLTGDSSRQNHAP